MNQVSDVSERYSPHGNGYIKMYRKLLTSAVFQSEKLLKVWIWCLIRANWHEATCFFEGKEIPLEIGQFITGRYTGSEECGLNSSTFYKCIKKLEEIGNISIKSDNKKSILTIVNYAIYQGDMSNEWQQCNNKVTTKEQQSNTDKEVKNIRSKEVRPHFQKPLIENVKAYFTELQLSNESDKFFDYYEGNGWRVGKNPMKDWKAAARNWKRNATKFQYNKVSNSLQSSNALAVATQKAFQVQK